MLVVSTTSGTAVAKHVIYVDARSIVQCRWLVFRIAVTVTSPDAECGTTQCRQAVSNVIYRYSACHLPVIYLQPAFVSVMSSTGTLSVIYDSHCYLDNDTNLKRMDRHAWSKRCYLISN